jgi:hypothetical protein
MSIGFGTGPRIGFQSGPPVMAVITPRLSWSGLLGRGDHGCRWLSRLAWASGAVLEAPALVAGLDDLAMVREPVEERGCHLGVAGEHAWPLAEGEVRGHDD